MIASIQFLRGKRRQLDALTASIFRLSRQQHNARMTWCSQYKGMIASIQFLRAVRRGRSDGKCLPRYARRSDRRPLDCRSGEGGQMANAIADRVAPEEAIVDRWTAVQERWRSDGNCDRGPRYARRSDRRLLAVRWQMRWWTAPLTWCLTPHGERNSCRCSHHGSLSGSAM